MSYSSLYGIDRDYKGKVIKEFKNLWLFAPASFLMLLFGTK